MHFILPISALELNILIKYAVAMDNNGHTKKCDPVHNHVEPS